MVAVFEDSIQILAQENPSTDFENTEISRSRLIGYGIAEFALDRWLTLYHGVERSALTIIPFPARATNFYRAVTQHLWGWLAQRATTGSGGSEALSFLQPSRLPDKFLQFLRGHPEIRMRSQRFFQRGLAVSRAHRPFWPTLLIGCSDSTLVAISDEYDAYPSTGGLEATCLSLDSVAGILWTDRSLLRRARISIVVEQQGRSLQLSWPASPRLKYAALGWIEAIDRSLVQARENRGETIQAGNWSGPAAQRH